LHGSRSAVLADEDGQVLDAESISAGLDYPGAGPEHAFLRDSGRAEYVSASDEEALDAFRRLARTEGILPALEPAHALAQVAELAEAAVAGGADLVELGFPFSDPLADGPVIRRAAEQALAQGMRTGPCLDVLAATRARLPAIPLVPMTYSSLLEAYGWER